MALDIINKYVIVSASHLVNHQKYGIKIDNSADVRIISDKTAFLGKYLMKDHALAYQVGK